ncbi:MAG: hypothetical protein AB8C13_09005 [Phycisphaerales bacterium]
MQFKLDHNSTAEEIGEFEQAAMKAGRFDLQHLAYGLRMTTDANRIKSPLLKADRFDLAYHALKKAVVEAKRIEERTGDSAPVMNATNTFTDYQSQYVTLSIQCIEAYHNERLSVLRKSKSGKRQLTSTRVTLNAFAKLDGRYESGLVGSAYEKALGYWRDQEGLLASYDD